MRIKARVLPAQYKLTDQERLDHAAYVSEFATDYKDLTPSDMRQLETASIQHILGLRLVAEALEKNTSIGLNSRYSWFQMERATLNDLALSRAARLKEKPTTSSEADELRSVLYALSDTPVKQIGKNHD